MKTLLSLFLLLAVGASAATGIKISEYPNTPVLTNSELFIVAVTNVTPATNRNISYGQLRSLLSSNNFVGSFTGDGRNVSNVVVMGSNVIGAVGSATNLAVPANFNAWLATYGSLYLPSGTYTQGSTLLIPANGMLQGQGSASTIIYFTNSQESIIMGTNSRLSHLRITSPYALSTATSNLFELVNSRCIAATNDCRIDDVSIDSASCGVSLYNATNVTIKGLRAKYIRDYLGWASVLHLDACKNVRATDIYGEDADRFIEVEDGCLDCVFDTGAGIRIRPVKFSGATGDYVTNYTWVLDAHSHDAHPRNERIQYKNFYLEDCGNAITCLSQSGTNSPIQSSWIDITVSNLANQCYVGYAAVQVDGTNNRIIRLRAIGLNQPSQFAAFSGAQNSLEDSFVDGVNNYVLVTSTDATNLTFCNNNFREIASAQSGAIWDRGYGTRILNNDFSTVTGTNGLYLGVASRFSRISGNKFPYPFLNAGTNNIRINNTYDDIIDVATWDNPGYQNSDIDHERGYIGWVNGNFEVSTRAIGAGSIAELSLGSQLYITNGRAGFFIDKPTSPLHLYRNTSDEVMAGGMLIEQAGAGDALLSFLITGNKAWMLGIDKSDGNKFKIGGSSGGFNADTVITMDTFSRVGIGTSNPTQLLSVYGGNIAASGAVIATNAFVMPPVSAGPDWCTNGLACMWNSNNNGQATIYLRTSAVGSTTYADKLMAP